MIVFYDLRGRERYLGTSLVCLYFFQGFTKSTDKLQPQSEVGGANSAQKADPTIKESSSGFQPYKPDVVKVSQESAVGHQATAAAAALQSNYMAAAAMAAGYHPSMFGLHYG